MVWHVDKYKITFKLVISHWTNEMSFSTHSRILFSSEYFHYKIFIYEKMVRKLKRQLPGEPLAARYNWCQGPVPGRGTAVEKHCPILCPYAYFQAVLSNEITVFGCMSSLFLRLFLSAPIRPSVRLLCPAVNAKRHEIFLFRPQYEEGTI